MIGFVRIAVYVLLGSLVLSLRLLADGLGQAVTGVSHHFPVEPVSRPGSIPPERIYRPPPQPARLA